MLKEWTRLRRLIIASLPYLSTTVQRYFCFGAISSTLSIRLAATSKVNNVPCTGITMLKNTMYKQRSVQYRLRYRYRWQQDIYNLITVQTFLNLESSFLLDFISSVKCVDQTRLKTCQDKTYALDFYSRRKSVRRQHCQ